MHPSRIPVADHTFGRRYIFASLDQTTVSIDTRVNVTFTPTLSLEIYAQPFLSSGAYADPMELRARRMFEFLTYGEDVGTAEHRDGKVEIDPDAGGPAGAFAVEDPDFNFQSLLGNAVLRWEWRAGSTLFLVWQQRRTGRMQRSGIHGADAGGIGGFDLERDSAELFRIRPDNIFLLKLNYWINP